MSNALQSGWRTYRFDKIAQSIAVRANPANVASDVYVGLEHLDPETIHLRRWGHPSDVSGDKLEFKKGDVIFGRRRAYQRKLAVADRDGICSAHAMVLRAKPEVILPELLPFFIQSDMFMERAISISVGSLSPTVNWKTLAVQEFPLPPPDEQKRMAEVLWASDVARESYKQSLLKTEQIEACLMDSFFNGLNDVRWVQASEACAKITVGIVVKPASYYVRTPGIPALRSLNVFPGRFELNEVVYISDDGNAKHKKSSLKNGDIVIVRTGRPGDSCVVSKAQEGFNAIDLIVVTPCDKFNPYYLSFFINSSLAKKQFRRGVAGTAQSHFNVNEFKKMLIPFIPTIEQERLLRIAKEIELTKSKLNYHLEKSKNISSCLVNQHYWGKDV